MAWPLCDQKVVSPTTIKLCLSPCKQGIHPVISVSNVHPYHPDPILECPLDLHPNPVLVDGSKEYEVESIAFPISPMSPATHMTQISTMHV